MTKVVMAPLMNCVTLIVTTNVTTFGTKTALGFLMRCSFNKEASLLKDIHCYPSNLPKFSWPLVSFKRDLWESSYLFCKTFFSLLKSLNLVCRFSQDLCKSSFSFFRTLFSFLRVLISYMCSSHIYYTLISLVQDNLLRQLEVF